MGTQQNIQTPANVADMTSAAKTAAAQAKPDKANTVADWLGSKSFQAQIANALPKFFDADRFTRSALTEFRTNTALQSCSVPSVLGYFMQAAALGLEPASALGQCYPVPFNNTKTGQRECQFIIGYRGMAALARRSGEVLSIDAQIVRELDEFVLEYGLDPKLTHKPCLDEDPGQMRGAYAVVRFRDGSFQYRFMSRQEIDSHRKRSKAAASGPWVSDYEEMAKKTVFRNMFKWLPIVIEEKAMLEADTSIARYDAKTGGVDVENMVTAEYTISQPEEDTP